MPMQSEGAARKRWGLRPFISYHTSPVTFQGLEGSTFRLQVLFPRGKARVGNAIVLLSTKKRMESFAMMKWKTKGRIMR